MLKGFEASWIQLKKMMDTVTGRQIDCVHVPNSLNAAQLSEQGINVYEYNAFSVSRVWDDSKLRNRDFHSVYGNGQLIVPPVTSFLPPIANNFTTCRQDVYQMKKFL